MDRFARYPSLDGRAVLVTGGASGIGAAIVAHVARQGARVAFLDFDTASGGTVATGALFLPCDPRDLGPDRIRVNKVVPGWVDIERQIALRVTPDAEARSQERQCRKGRLQPDDIARLVLRLAAADSARVTAQHSVMDGGGS